MTGFSPFLRLNDNRLYVYITFCLSIHLLMDTWVASSSWSIIVSNECCYELGSAERNHYIVLIVVAPFLGEGPPKKPELFLEGGPFVVQAYTTRWVVLGTHLYQCTNWHCERLCLASVNFFLILFQHVCPFHDGWLTSIPAHLTVSAQQFFWPKTVWPLSLTLFARSCPNNFFCFPRWKKSSKGNVLLMWKKWNKKRQK